MDNAQSSTPPTAPDPDKTSEQEQTAVNGHHLPTLANNNTENSPSAPARTTTSTNVDGTLDKAQCSTPPPAPEQTKTSEQKQTAVDGHHLATLDNTQTGHPPSAPSERTMTGEEDATKVVGRKTSKRNREDALRSSETHKQGVKKKRKMQPAKNTGSSNNNSDVKDKGACNAADTNDKEERVADAHDDMDNECVDGGDGNEDESTARQNTFAHGNELLKQLERLSDGRRLPKTKTPQALRSGKTRVSKKRRIALGTSTNVATNKKLIKINNARAAKRKERVAEASRQYRLAEKKRKERMHQSASDAQDSQEWYQRNGQWFQNHVASDLGQVHDDNPTRITPNHGDAQDITSGVTDNGDDWYQWKGEWYKWDNVTENTEYPSAKDTKRDRVNTRLRNWIAAMRRNMKPQCKAAALQPFTITRDRLDEVCTFLIHHVHA